MRTFIAIPLAEDSHRLLEQLQNQLRAAAAEVRWTSTASIHLTLKFLGEIDPAVVGKTADRLRTESRALAPFTLSLGGLGAFPTIQNPRVVWCGVSGDIEQLGLLQHKVEQECTRLGFAPEERPFHPHLTLGRVRGRRNLHRLAECIKIGSDSASALTVSRFNIYKSTLTPRGAIYDILEPIELSP